MKVLVIGGRGMLGNDVVAELTKRDIEFGAPTSAELDITDPEVMAKLGERADEFDWCINCSAYTAVDKAEEDRDNAFKINYSGVSLLGGALSFGKCRLLHVSTDFVFDGAKTEPYVETDLVNPLGAYGESKLAGEEAAMHYGAVVCRTAWLYGPNGNSFPKTMIRAWKAGKTLRVVADQIGSPTYTRNLARVLVDIIELPQRVEPGIYHTAGPESMSWHEFATRAIETYSGSRPEITPINTEDWPTPAKRPKYSVLSFEKVAALGIEPMRPVDEALREFVVRLPSLE